MENLSPVHQKIVSLRVWEEAPIKRIAKAMDLTAQEVRDILKDKGVQVEMARQETERGMLAKAEFNKNYKASMKFVKEVFKLPNTSPIINNQGDPVGERVDKDILKIKKEIAMSVLENVGAVDVKKGGGITFNQQINNTTEKEDTKKIEEQERRKEIAIVLKDCMLEPGEKNDGKIEKIS